MLRFILRRQFKDECNGAETEFFETVDVEAKTLEAMLGRGGRSENGYDLTQLIGVEILHPVQDVVAL